ncbi:uncharacterized protein LOC124161474 [Ischnura elegans]|uniref:uncharacterized protein LOC124161474 n=1 Tax=Ischnura elegans TaxID=197161 RepID=UPI001ED872CF|nr:uncharacterized protein LOC124161474 [Ischnura elegans]
MVDDRASKESKDGGTPIAVLEVNDEHTKKVRAVRMSEEEQERMKTTLKSIRLEETDILASFDVVSLFTRIPVEETTRLLETRFDRKTVELFQHVLRSTYFLCNGQFYEQTEGVPMGSPLSPAIANLFMEDFEEKALETAPLRPKYFFRYVDDTLIVWPHGIETLPTFLEHMNGVNPSIKFTMEVENNRRLPFLDILIERKENGNIGHSVYRKPTHTELYLNASSHHHPAQKKGVLTTLFHRAKAISDDAHLIQEISHLKSTFRKNGYNHREIQAALKRTSLERNNREEKEKPVARACLPYISSVSNKISRILKRHNIEAIHKPSSKIKTCIGTPKDDLGLKTSGDGSSQ